MKPKRISLLVILIYSVLCVYAIYNLYFKNNIDYLSLGDEIACGKTPFNTYEKSYADYLVSYLKNKNKFKSYNDYFTKSDYRVIDLLHDIKENKTKTVKNQKITIDNLISKADIITISIGREELTSNVNQAKIDTIFYNIEYLIEMIRKITNKPILFIGYYNLEEYTKNYTDKKIEEIINKNNKVYWIDIDETFDKKSNYLPNKENLYPSLEGQNYIFNKIIEVIEKKNLI